MPTEQKTQKTLIMRVFEEETMNKMMKIRENEDIDNALLIKNKRYEQRRLDTESRDNSERIK